MADRRARLREAASEQWDVVVIGGGINGAGIARDAAMRGLRVLLIDKHDWGFGTTWRSTKLIHGGLRYLEYGEIPLVFESLRERAVLQRIAAHLVRPMPFLLPVFAGARHGLPLLRAGLAMYDLLALGGGLPRHRTLSPGQARAAEPRLRCQGLRGALGYWDCQVALPERLCIENVLSARDAGAEAFTYVEAGRIETEWGRVAAVHARDTESGEGYVFRASLAVNAAGPWVDAVLRGAPLDSERIGGTRGTHLVVRFDDDGPRRAIYAEAHADGRPFFIIPWRGVHLIGTTDIRAGGPDDLRPTAAEVDYLIEATQRLLPDTARFDVWYAYAGIRPLPRASGVKEAAVTRRHYIVEHGHDGFAGLYSVIGGKLSTYRSLAADVTDRLMAALSRRSAGCETGRVPLVSGSWVPRAGKPEQQRLWNIYGPRGGALLDAIRERPDRAAPLCPHTLETGAQVLHAVRREEARTVADVLLRRTPAGWAPCLGLDAAPRVASLLAEDLGWDDRQIDEAVAEYRREVAKTFLTVQDQE